MSHKNEIFKQFEWCERLYLLGDEPNFEFSDEVVIREKATKVSGKLGGVAGVLHGVIYTKIVQN